jgi:hypothetical protein
MIVSLCVGAVAVVAKAASAAGDGYSPFPAFVDIPFANQRSRGAWLRANTDSGLACFAYQNHSDIIQFGRLGSDLAVTPSQHFDLNVSRIESWTIADLDSDGDDDLVLMTDSPYQAVVIVQHPDSFEIVATVASPAATGNTSAAAGDFNGDGLVDVAFASSGRLNVFLATGPWTYGTWLQLSDNLIWRNMRVAPFDSVPGDEIIVLAGNRVLCYSFAGGTPSLLTSPTLTITPEFVHVGDLRGQGVQEILVADQQSSTVKISTLVLEQSALVVSASATFGPNLLSGFAVADVDGDGRADFLTSSQIFYGRETDAGTVPFEIQAEATAIAWDQVVDVDGDGLNDLSRRSTSSFYLTLGDGERFATSTLVNDQSPIGEVWLEPFHPDDPLAPGVFSSGVNGRTPVSLRVEEAGNQARLVVEPDPRVRLDDASLVRFEDINGDGVSDLLGEGGPSTSGRSNYLFWALGDGDGGYGVQVSREIGFDTSLPILFDANGDGINDVVRTSYDALLIWEGHHSGIFGPEVRVTIPYRIAASAFIDMDGDGHIDLLRFPDGFDPIEITYSVLSDPTRDVREIDSPSGIRGSSDGTYPAVDFNGDGIVDFVVPTQNGLAYAMSNGPRSYGPFTGIPLFEGSGTYGKLYLRAGDLDGDTYPDLVFFGPNGFAILGPSATRTLAVRALAPGASGLGLLHDIDDDGDLDIVRSSQDRSVVYLNPGVDRCLADYTIDGALNFYDIALFLTDLRDGNRFADMTRDGVLNFFDLAAFIAAFNQGCDE